MVNGAKDLWVVVCVCRADVVRDWRRKWDACGRSFRAQNQLLIDISWDKTMHKPSLLCVDTIRLVLPVSFRRVHAMRQRCRLARDSGDMLLLSALETGHLSRQVLMGGPPNKLAAAAREGIWEFLDLYTRTDPTAAWLRCTQQDLNSVGKMWRRWVQDNPEFGHVSQSTFQRQAHAFCADEGVKGIKGVDGDHNVSLSLSRTSVRRACGPLEV